MDEHRLFIGVRWVSGGSLSEVRNKYTGEAIGALPIATRADVEEAVTAAERAAPACGRRGRSPHPIQLSSQFGGAQGGTGAGGRQHGGCEAGEHDTADRG